MKEKKSKLDQFAATLADMDEAHKTIAEIQAWLKEEGVTVSTGRISVFLESLRSSRLASRLLGQISTGADQCRKVEKAFAKNPAPEMETLIKLHRVLIMKLSTAGNAEPEFLKLADQLTRTAMEFISGQTKHKLETQKLGLQERKVTLLEKKAAAFDKAKGVLESTLSPEQQRLALKEILK